MRIAVAGKDFREQFVAAGRTPSPQQLVGYALVSLAVLAFVALPSLIPTRRRAAVS